ncbi:uncharacterized protein LOC133347978 [Lethenteron reissneri]|uniref:uncharacterized protein LOC133347978 n=1 Tax=Lethenteron reissneri TaxID=7753 RepID=UPI002AB6B173|nr:uncharacterized protein LOC133347978 [Lethenteron reissneri]
MVVRSLQAPAQRLAATLLLLHLPFHLHLKQQQRQHRGGHQQERESGAVGTPELALWEATRELGGHLARLRASLRRQQQHGRWRARLEAMLDEHKSPSSVREQLKDLTKQYDKSENDLKALQSVGQNVGEVLKQLTEDKFIVKATNGPRYVVGCRRQLDKSKLKAGTRVALDMTTLTIMRYLPREVDPLVYNMSHEDPGQVSYSEIGGLTEQIRELREVRPTELYRSYSEATWPQKTQRSRRKIHEPRGEHANSKYTGIKIETEPTTSCTKGKVVNISPPWGSTL